MKGSHTANLVHTAVCSSTFPKIHALCQLPLWFWRIFSRLLHDSRTFSPSYAWPSSSTSVFVIHFLWWYSPVYLEKSMTVSSVSACEGMLLVQGCHEEQSLLTETSSLPTLCQGVNSLCPNAVLQLQHQNPPHLQADQTIAWHDSES